VARWVDGAPGRFLSGVGLWVGREGLEISPDSLRALQAAGRLDGLGEVTAQYSGVAPGDEAMEPYWELAVELDLPVGLHMGIGSPGVRYLGMEFEVRAGDPLALEEVLIRHPGLRVYVMHAGFPMFGEMLALMWAHPQVYVDTGAWISLLPRATAEDYLRRLVEAGMWKRILFGSDADRFPQGMERGIRIIQEAPFLTEEQKRDILYNNAARFLRLDEETIRRHHAGG
jgi:predicted TIM-barrel fold metal-dependent hydrolase